MITLKAYQSTARSRRRGLFKNVNAKYRMVCVMFAMAAVAAGRVSFLL
jgi:hypothetical protein